LNKNLLQSGNITKEYIKKELEYKSNLALVALKMKNRRLRDHIWNDECADKIDWEKEQKRLGKRTKTR